MPRKIIAGYWQDEEVQKRLGRWMRAAVGVAVSRQLKVMRFGDNMREVAVTEGDEVQARLGRQVNTCRATCPGENEVDAEIDALMEVYRASYDFVTDDIGAICYQAREEIASRRCWMPKDARRSPTPSRTCTAWSSCRVWPAST